MFKKSFKANTKKGKYLKGVSKSKRGGFLAMNRVNGEKEY